MNKKAKNILKVIVIFAILSMIILTPIMTNAATYLNTATTSTKNSNLSAILESAAQKYTDVKNYQEYLGNIESFTNGLDTNMAVDETKIQIIDKATELQKKYNAPTSISKISSQIVNTTINSNATDTSDLLSSLMGTITNLLGSTNLAIESLTPDVTVDDMVATTAGGTYGEEYNVKLSGNIYYAEVDKNGNPTSDKWVYLIHGANMTGQAMADAVGHMYLEQGYNILAPDSRGCGNSDGKVELGYIESLDAWDWLTYLNNTYGKKCQKVILHGISLGGATTLFASGLEVNGKTIKDQNVIGLVEDCGYTSLTDEIINKLLINNSNNNDVEENSDTYPNALDGLNRCELPILIIHGTNDEIVPYENSTEIYNTAMSNSKIPYVQRFTAKGEKHAFIVLETKYNVYEGHVENFINKAEDIANGNIIDKEADYQEQEEQKTSLMANLIKALKLIKNIIK